MNELACKYTFKTNVRDRNLSNNCSKRNWVINLSSRKFTDYELSVLSKDPKFQIVTKQVNKAQIIANIETNLKEFVNDPVELENIRQNLVYILKISSL